MRATRTERLRAKRFGEVSPEVVAARRAVARKDASERSEASHANGASRRSGARESV